jgi:hypothetical protein
MQGKNTVKQIIQSLQRQSLKRRGFFFLKIWGWDEKDESEVDPKREQKRNDPEIVLNIHDKDEEEALLYSVSFQVSEKSSNSSLVLQTSRLSLALWRKESSSKIHEESWRKMRMTKKKRK